MRCKQCITTYKCAPDCHWRATMHWTKEPLVCILVSDMFHHWTSFCPWLEDWTLDPIINGLQRHTHTHTFSKTILGSIMNILMLWCRVTAWFLTPREVKLWYTGPVVHLYKCFTKIKAEPSLKMNDAPPFSPNRWFVCHPYRPFANSSSVSSYLYGIVYYTVSVCPWSTAKSDRHLAEFLQSCCHV